MKKLILILTIVTCGCNNYRRIGDMTMISTRNIEPTKDYILIQKGVEGVAKFRNSDALEAAIDDAVMNFEHGEFMKNAAISVKRNGRKIKVVGDVWGTKISDANMNVSEGYHGGLKIGDVVSYKTLVGKVLQGKIIGINNTTAIVERKGFLGRKSKSHIKYEELTKMGEN